MSDEPITVSENGAAIPPYNDGHRLFGHLAHRGIGQGLAGFNATGIGVGSAGYYSELINFSENEFTQAGPGAMPLS